MKAVLVIDIPEGVFIEDCIIDYEVQESVMQKVVADGVKRLKALPNRLDANDWHRMFGGLFSEREAKGYGWNACLDEILEETE